MDLPFKRPPSACQSDYSNYSDQVQVRLSQMPEQDAAIWYLQRKKQIQQIIKKQSRRSTPSQSARSRNSKESSIILNNLPGEYSQSSIWFTPSNQQQAARQFIEKIDNVNNAQVHYQSIYDRQKQWVQKKQEKLKCQLQNKEKSQQSQCTFNPKINKYQQNAVSNVAQRSQKWLQQKQQRDKEKQELIQAQEISQCTFKPKITAQPNESFNPQKFYDRNVKWKQQVDKGLEEQRKTEFKRSFSALKYKKKSEQQKINNPKFDIKVEESQFNDLLDSMKSINFSKLSDNLPRKFSNKNLQQRHENLSNALSNIEKLLEGL